MTHEEALKIYESLANRFCERKALRCLAHFLPAYFCINGLTDGWQASAQHLKELRALGRDLKEDELNDLRELIAYVDTMLTRGEKIYKSEIISAQTMPIKSDKVGKSCIKLCNIWKALKGLFSIKK